MTLLAHSGGGPVLASLFEPWEVHPVLVHFPIAFLLGGVVLGLCAWRRGSAALDRVATGLLIAGVAFGLLTGLAGLLAMFTLPAITKESGDLMLWHLGVQLAAVLLFALCAWLGWRAWEVGPSAGVRVLGWVAAVLLVGGSAVGGYMVYHGGAGIEPALLTRAVREGRDPGQARDSNSHDARRAASPRDGGR